MEVIFLTIFATIGYNMVKVDCDSMNAIKRREHRMCIASDKEVIQEVFKQIREDKQ